MASSTQRGIESSHNRILASISVLSGEIMTMIFECIHDASPSTITSLTLVDKHFYMSAFPFKHRHQKFTFDEDPSASQNRETYGIITSLLGDQKKHILLGIRSITVMSMESRSAPRPSAVQARQRYEYHRKKWLRLAELLKQISSLRKFTLQGKDHVSIPLLNALKDHQPQARLHLENWTRYNDDEDYNNSAELALAYSPNLRSLKTQLEAPKKSVDLRLAALERIVALSPTLESIDVSAAESKVSTSYRPGELEEQWRIYDNFLENVIFSTNSIQSLRSSGGRLQALYMLGNVTPLSALHTLHAGYIDRLATSNNVWHGGNYPNLRHFSFALDDTAGPDVCGLMYLFLENCPPLESLSITDGANFIVLPLSTIMSHGPTLRTLVLHNVEKVMTNHLVRSISVKELQQLSESCSGLEDITIDADGTSLDEGFAAILSVLATFPRLHTIRIYLPLGVDEEATRTPHVFLDKEEVIIEINKNRTCPKPYNLAVDGWLETAWALLRHEKKKNGSKPLKELHVKVGQWERDVGDDYPAGWVVWEAINRRYFILTPHERDDKPNDINIYIKGTKTFSDIDSHEIRRIPAIVHLEDCSPVSSDQTLTSGVEVDSASTS